MANDTITLMLEGDIGLEAFNEATKAFTSLVLALTAQEGGDIDWIIEDLAPGSALATIRGKSRQPERVERVVHDYLNVGKAIQRNEPLHRPPAISRPALRLARMAGTKVRTVRFETAEDEAVISAPPSRRKKSALAALSPTQPIEFPDATLGAVEGEVQTLTKRHGLRFTLYDSLGDRAVSCYLQPGQEEQMRSVWGKRAIVEGWVSRDPISGRPVSIRRITNIILITEEGDYTQARGILPLATDGELPEVRIRRLRDE